MAETTQPSPAPAAIPAAPAAPATPEPQASPLEKVYTDFGIEAEAERFQPQSPAPAQPAAPATPATPAFKVPDPFSPDFGAYQAQLASGVSALHQSLQQTQQQLTALDRQLNQRRVEADIDQAAKTLAAKANIDHDVAAVAFEAQARKDPRLLHIWNNRAKNPKALEAALNALGTEFAQKYVVRQDPQLVENQRAVAASRQTMATTQKTSDADQWAEMTPTERQAKVQQLLRQGGR